MADQSDEDRLSGILRLRFGGVETEVPALPLRPARVWVAQLRERLAGVAALSSDRDTDVIWRLSDAMTDSAVDLIVAYDRDGVIGGADWLLDHATPREIKSALDTMREEALPFGDTVTLMDLAVMAVQSLAPSSTNGPSPTGDSDPTPLNRRSRRGNYRSSGTKDKSA